MTKQSWKPVVGHEGLYEVSDRGEVRSIDRRVPQRRPNGRIVTTFVAGRSRRLQITKDGHVSVSLSKDGIARKHFVHTLVLEAFVSPRPPGLEALHRDGQGTNNAAGNLRWGTHAENVQDALRHGVHVAHPGSRNGRSILTEPDIPIIRERLKNEFPASIARDYGVNRSTIQQIKRGQTWSHIPPANDNRQNSEAA